MNNWIVLFVFCLTAVAVRGQSHSYIQRTYLSSGDTVEFPVADIDTFKHEYTSNRWFETRKLDTGNNIHYDLKDIDSVVFIAISNEGKACPRTPTVTDIDGNEYRTVQIGDQCWTKENYRGTRYQNGDTVKHLFTADQWREPNDVNLTGGWCYPDNNPASDSLYGKLYNFYAVEDPRGLCPAGWHTPGYDDFHELADHLGGMSVAGEKMKADSAVWDTVAGVTGTSGFDAVPSPIRDDEGEFVDYRSAHWWSFTRYARSYSILKSDSSLKQGGSDRNAGYGCRCVRDD